MFRLKDVEYFVEWFLGEKCHFGAEVSQVRKL